MLGLSLRYGVASPRRMLDTPASTRQVSHAHRRRVVFDGLTEQDTRLAAMDGFERLPLPDGELWWAPEFVPAPERAALLARVLAEVPWEQHRLRLFGRERPAPRLSCWIGDPGAAYTYSRVRFEPRPWTPTLTALRARLEAATGARYNSVLANRYRSGADAMGWHADDEPELGPEPVIASLSLGAPRRFLLQPRAGGPSRALTLTDGSLLVMCGATQRHWRHALPRAAGVAGERVNLTYRWIRR